MSNKGKMAKKNITPIIQKTTVAKKNSSKTTLKDKAVNIAGTEDFKRKTTDTKGKPVKKTEEQRLKDKRDEKRKITMKTQKMSLDVLLKLEILEPFLRSSEDLDEVKNITINEKIDILIENYLNLKLSSRQQDGFKSIYNNYTT